MAEERPVNENDKHVVIGSASNFWRYSHENGFDLTRRNADQTCRSISLPTTTMPISIDPNRSALVIIDMQNFFIHPAMRNHATGIDASNKLLEYAIPAARKAGIQIIWLNWGLTEEDVDQLPPALKRTFGRGLLEEPWYMKTAPTTIYKGFGTELGDFALPNGEHIDAGRLLMRDAWNAKLYDPLFDSYASSQESKKPDQLFHKNRISGLWSHQSPVLSYLEDNKFTTLFFAGVNTDQCVSGTLQDAYSKGFDCILLSDGCGTTSPSFARECIEYNCSGGGNFMMNIEQFATGIETSLA